MPKVKQVSKRKMMGNCDDKKVVRVGYTTRDPSARAREYESQYPKDKYDFEVLSVSNVRKAEDALLENPHATGKNGGNSHIFSNAPNDTRGSVYAIREKK